MRFLLIILITYIGNSFGYDIYIPKSNDLDVKKQYNQCFVSHSRSKIKEYIKIKNYKNGHFKAYKYKEKINHLFLVTDEPYRPNGEPIYQFNGIVAIDYNSLKNYYSRSNCF